MQLWGLKIQSLRDVARVYLQTLGYGDADVSEEDIAFVFGTDGTDFNNGAFQRDVKSILSFATNGQFNFGFYGTDT